MTQSPPWQGRSMIIFKAKIGFHRMCNTLFAMLPEILSTFPLILLVSKMGESGFFFFKTLLSGMILIQNFQSPIYRDEMKTKKAKGRH